MKFSSVLTSKLHERRKKGGDSQGQSKRCPERTGWRKNDTELSSAKNKNRNWCKKYTAANSSESLLVPSTGDEKFIGYLASYCNHRLQCSREIWLPRGRNLGLRCIVAFPFALVSEHSPTREKCRSYKASCLLARDDFIKFALIVSPTRNLQVEMAALLRMKHGVEHRIVLFLRVLCER